MLDQNKIDMYLMINQKYFPEERIFYLKEKRRTWMRKGSRCFLP